jgi:hypothetical protein
MTLASELVTDSKLETIFKKNLTIHVVKTAGTTPLQGKNRKRQKWKRIEALGQGSFGFVWRETLVGGGDKDIQDRAVKGIKKGFVTDYSQELHAIAKFSQDRVGNLPFNSEPWPIRLRGADAPTNAVQLIVRQIIRMVRR